MAIFSGIAALVTSAVGAISTFVGGLGVVGSFVLRAAVGVGLSLLAKAIAGKKSTDTPSFAVSGQLQSGGTVSRSIILGMTATAGSLVYANTWGSSNGTPNAYVTQVIAVSDVPTKGFLAVIVNGVACDIDYDQEHPEYGWPVSDYNVNGTYYLWVKFYDGTQTTADSFLVNQVSSTARPYESTRVGHGVSYVIATARVNDTLFSGFPSFKFVIDGMKLYNPLNDSSVGGSGSHRWSDPSTWGGTGDTLPVVQLYNLMRGIRYNGEWLYGLQTVGTLRLPAAHWISQIQKCSALIEGPEGPEYTYRSGAEVSVDAKIQDAIDAILTSCQGRLAEIGGTYKPYVGAPGSPVYTFTDSDILSTEEQSFTPFFGLSDTVNGITASYPSVDDVWSMTTAAPLYNSDYEAEDGSRRLLADVSLDFVPYAGQVQRLMKSALAEARRARRHTISMPPAFWVLEPGDIVSWTSSRNGYDAKLFRVDGVLDQPNLDVVLDITEVDPADYDWDQATDYRTPVTGNISTGTVASQPMYGWQALPATIYDTEGRARRASIQVSCDSGQDDVKNVWVQVRLKSNLSVEFDSSATVYASPYSWVLNGTFLPATTYQVRGKFVPYSNRATDWSDWLDVITPDVRFLAGVDYDPYDGAIGLGDLDDDLANYQDWIGNGLRDIQITLQELDARIADLDLGSGTMRNQIRANISAEFDGVRADYTSQIDVVAGKTAAVATSVTTLTATFNSQTASFNTQITALSAADTAISNSVTALTSTFNTQTATFNTQIATLSSADTALSARVDTLTATLTDPTTGLQATANAVSSLSTTVTSVDGKVTAVATALTSLSAASSSGDVNTANFQMSVLTGPDGYSRIGALARQGGAGAWRSAAWYLDVPNDTSLPTRFLVEAGQFIVVAGGNLNNPFVVDGTAVRMNVANIGTVNAGVMQSSNGKMVINLTAGTIVISS